MKTVEWWTKTLNDWDGTVILARVMMWTNLCWAACLDGAEQQTDPARRRERLDEANEWREAYRVAYELVYPEAATENEEAKRA